LSADDIFIQRFSEKSAIPTIRGMMIYPVPKDTAT